ncbi:TRAP transporter small permease subunit [Pseudorhodobacter ferrugineus]|uniref:TRAP transporter small permease subunit n=1 Tax=Pseudorhodobacter ferrugineus TaxID=77008 RepID=UPI0003B42AE0|nr:TRAP transporter small permease [Pseudorhodobacter ferrugineus]
MRASSASRELLWPLVFVFAAGYLAWYTPRLIVFSGHASDAMITRFPTAGVLEFLALFGAIGSLVIGVLTIRPTAQEGTNMGVFDRMSLFMGRVTMLLIVSLVLVMFYEVVARYVFEKPTLWANELSLWMAGAIFLFSGLYAMQQRSHIRIYLLYDMMPRNLQRVCDLFSTALIVGFAFVMLWGSYNEARDKFMRWETFGTAFDPPIPATIKPLLIVFICLVALQAVINLINDWGKDKEIHAVVDESEIEEFVQEMGAKLTKKG